MMKRAFLTGASVVAVAAFLLAVPPATRSAEEAEKESPCCFDREAYPSYCSVTPGEDETCASILTFLNTPGSVGKTYCGGTKLRGGWTKLDCEEAAKGEQEEEKK